MKITMLTNKLGSDNGITTRHYDKGETYEVSDALGACFVEEKVAELAVGEKAVAPVPDTKAIAAAPENKAIAAAPKNKAK